MVTPPNLSTTRWAQVGRGDPTPPGVEAGRSNSPLPNPKVWDYASFLNVQTLHRWSGIPARAPFVMALGSERRRYSRFDMTWRECKLTLIGGTTKNPASNCRLLDLGYGGMRFRGGHQFREGEVYDFLIDMPRPLQGVVSVKAQIRWVRRVDVHTSDLGAVFLESSRSWLGPEESAFK